MLRKGTDSLLEKTEKIFSFIILQLMRTDIKPWKKARLSLTM